MPLQSLLPLASYFKIEKGVSNLWSLPLNGSKPKQLTKFEFRSFINFARSLDNKNLALLRKEEISDVVLIRDFK